MRSATAAAFPELLAAVIGIGLIGTIVAGGIAGDRQRRSVEAASARLEEAQNLLARWRAGGAAEAPGWRSEVGSIAPGIERLTLRADGVTISTMRPAAP